MVQNQTDTPDHESLLAWARNFSGSGSAGVNELADVIDSLLGRVRQLEGQIGEARGIIETELARTWPLQSALLLSAFDFPAPEAEDNGCEEELHSWDYFKPDQVRPYFMKCYLSGLHDQHENNETGAKWRVVV